MPHMYLAGRRLLLASDDFVFTSCLSLGARLIGAVVLVIVSIIHGQLLFGSTGTVECARLGWYTAVSLAVFGALVVHSIALCRVAGLGGVLQPTVRSRVAHVLVTGVFLRGLELGCAIYGALQLRNIDTDGVSGSGSEGETQVEPGVACDQDADAMLRSVNTMQWVFLCVGMCCSCTFYRGSKAHKKQNNLGDTLTCGMKSLRSITGYTQKDIAEQAHLVQKLTSFRQCCCCNICKDVDDNVFEVVAKELHQYFAGWDVVVTDIIAGLVLTAQLQAESRTKVQVHSSRKLSTETRIKQDGSVNSEHSQQHQALPSEADIATQQIAEADSVAAALDDDQEDEVEIFVTPEWSCGTDAQMSTLEEGLQRHITNHVLSRHVQADVDVVRDLKYFLRFALGVYGWLLHAFRHAHRGLVCAPCALCNLMPCVQTGCSCLCMPRHLGVQGDNCCRCNQTAVFKTFGDFWSPADQPELIYMSLNDLVEMPAYNICVDKLRRKVVVAIRGTLSIQDCMTDCIADDQSLDELGLAGEFAHDGMYKSACNIQRDLIKHNLLSLLLNDGHVPADHATYVEPACQDCRGFDLVVCGHSLGAGTAALLTMMLRPNWPSIHCYAFSPPGGLLSENAAISTREYITSVILGDDFIGRLSMRSMELLKDEMIECLSHCKAPKHSIIAGAALASCGLRPTSAIVDEPDLAHVGTNEGIHADEDHKVYLDKHRASRIKDGTLWLKDRKMLPPGKVLFLRRLGPHGHHRLEPEWAANDEFQRIAVSSRMLTDHLPNKLQDALDKIADTMGVGTASDLEQEPQP